MTCRILKKIFKFLKNLNKYRGDRGVQIVEVSEISILKKKEIPGKSSNKIIYQKLECRNRGKMGSIQKGGEERL